MIIKVQLPISPNLKDPQALAYNEDGSFKSFIPLVPELLEAMGESKKRYFEATYHDNGILELHGEAEPQSW